MADHSVVRSSDGSVRDLLLMVEPQSDVDSDEVDRSTRQLRAELKDLDIESITHVVSRDAPPGTKGVDPSSLTALLITLSATGGILTILIETARDWLARQAAVRRISVTIDGDTIVLEKGSARERSALIDAYIRHHEAK